MAKILVVEDDRALNAFVSARLRDFGYEVKSCYDGLSALEVIYEEKLSLICSDVMMPNMDGFELAEKVRALDKNIPIIFLSAKDDKPSKLYGYALGIDDYVTKPFDMDELAMKINALLRRAMLNSETSLSVGNLTMNKDERTVTINGEEVPFTVKEFDLLYKLLSYPKKTFTRANLMDDLWDYDSSATSRTVDVYMAKLREKTLNCDGFTLMTVHGLGYKAVLK